MIKEVFDNELEFSIQFEYEENPFFVTFRVVEVVPTYSEENYKTPVFNNYEMGSGVDSQPYTFEESFNKHPFCSGFIRWDGCMEIHGLSYHFCGSSDILQRLTDKIYEGGKQIIGINWDEDLANF